MPELTLEIGGRMYEVACEAGQETSLETAAGLLDAEASQVTDLSAPATEKRTLLLAGLMIADRLNGMRVHLAETEEKLRAAEEKVRITEAKSAMLAANALKAENRYSGGEDAEQLKAENDMAVELLAKVLRDLNDLAEQVETGKIGA